MNPISRSLMALLSLAALAGSPLFAAAPAAGDVVFNEYVSDNNASGNDYLELLILKDHTDLRGLRFSDNELLSGSLNQNETVGTFGTDTFLGDLPAGTLVAVWMLSAGVTTDTVINEATSDYQLVLAPGTGVTFSVDGLGGNNNPGLANAGEALYLYLPGPNGNSAGTDNVYLDFVSFKADGGDAPTGLTDLNLPSPADNAYYTGSTAAGNDLAANWVTHDLAANWTSDADATPGQPNPGQDLSSLRVAEVALTPAVVVTPSGGSTLVAEGGATDTYTLNLTTVPTGTVTVTVTGNADVEVSTDGTTFGSSRTVALTGLTPATVTVRAIDDAAAEGSENTSLTHAITTSLDAVSYPTSLSVGALAVTVQDNDLGTVRIRDIQGSAHLSPLAGESVAGVPGIVTAKTSNGFYLQDPSPDANVSTSEGIFVFTSSAPTVSVGDSVLVSGVVTEFRPGGNANNLTLTELVSPVVSVVSTGNSLPAAIVIGSGGRTPPTSIISNDAVGGNVENAGTVFDPAEDGIDFYESLEGMRVQVNNPLVSGPTSGFGEIWVLADGGVNATSTTATGGALVGSSTDFNPELIQLDDTLIPSLMPAVNAGDTLSTVVGVVDYNFNYFRIQIGAAPTVTPGSLTRETTTLAGDSEHLTVATINVENLDPADGATKFNNLATIIVTGLKAPDVISVEEMQDNNGPTNDSTVAADQTFQTLINAIVTAGGPTYQYRQINPVDDLDGGEPGGNIRQGFLFNPIRVSFVDRAGATATTATTVQDVLGVPQLSHSPGRIAPTDAAFNSSRKPLAAEFVFQGKTLFVIGNHFNSKGGDQPLYGPSQPPTLSSEVQRNQQAALVATFVQAILTVDADARIVVLGDLNDFVFSNPLKLLTDTGLSNLFGTLPANERYSYVFQGNAQVLDHILVSPALVTGVEFDAVHLNAEFDVQDSDHDPLVARLLVDVTPPTLQIDFTRSGAARRIVFTASDTGDSNPGIYLQDSASAFVAGPFRDGDVIQLRLNPRQDPYMRSLPGAVLVQVKGEPTFFSEDASGNQTSAIRAR